MEHLKTDLVSAITIACGVQQTSMTSVGFTLQVLFLSRNRANIANRRPSGESTGLALTQSL